MTIAFNTLTYFEELKAAGVSEREAKVHADTLNKIVEGDLATKSDIVLLRKDMSVLQTELKSDMKALEYKLTIRLGSMIIGASIATVSILGFLIKLGH